MAVVRDFREIKVWEKSHYLTLATLPTDKPVG